MSCRDWLDMLADYLDGGLAPESRTTFERHADACGKCARLLATVRDGDAPTEAAPDLTSAVLARTSGPACGLVERTIAGREIAHRDVEYHAMVRRHLEHCPRCRALEAVLTWLVPMLPAMAETTPDHAFAAGVIRATSRAPGRMSWRARVGRWWEGVASVPLFELQAAYVGAALLVVLGGSPVVPIRYAANFLVSIDSQFDSARSRADAASERLTAAAAPLWHATGGRVLDPVQSAVRQIEMRYVGTTDAASVLWSDFRNVAGALRDGEYTAASNGVRLMRSDVVSLWKALRHGEVSASITGGSEGSESTRAPRADEHSVSRIS
jgi:anti-sigma factor RsiW